MKNVKAGHSKPIVVLDAGHFGKYNRSPVVPEYYESDMNWKLHHLLKAELISYGIEVRLTRTDKEQDLNEYYRGTASEGADLFLSIHSNAASRENADHAVVYVPLNGKGNEIGKALATCISQVMETTEAQRVAVREGSNGDYYGVIRGATAVGTIGLILEHSFHTNTRATKWLLDDNNLVRMAKAEAEVVAAWFDVQKPQDAPDEPERWYRIRKSWDDAKSQIGAYKDLERAKKVCPEGYSVYDWNGQAMYTNTPKQAEYTLTLPVLRSGDTGETVKALQQLLLANNIDLDRYGADGSFGPVTESGVLDYQEKVGIATDGIVGEETMEKLLGLR